MVLHSIPNAGKVLLPLHFIVLICGLVTGPVYGVICGILTTSLSSILTGMPPAFILPSMMCELSAYGLINNLLIQVGNYSLEIWLTSAFITALPGIIIQIILIPFVVMAINKSTGNN